MVGFLCSAAVAAEMTVEQRRAEIAKILGGPPDYVAEEAPAAEGPKAAADKVVIENGEGPAKPADAAADSGESALTCADGTKPDSDGCCPGETSKIMDDGQKACCPASGPDCFPPI